jgi:hypothetical protein
MSNTVRSTRLKAPNRLINEITITNAGTNRRATAGDDESDNSNDDQDRDQARRSTEQNNDLDIS